MKSILNGKVYNYQLGNWQIVWESNGLYRHWCVQIHSNNKKTALVVMLNPGSLSGDGKNLTRDSTLRILREVFLDTGINPFVINLFDYAATSPDTLFEDWDRRDNDELIYDKLNCNDFLGILFVYGDCENRQDYGSEVSKRIKMIKNKFITLREIVLPKNSSGSPKHPMIWQRQKIKPEIKKIIASFYMSSR